MKILFLHPNLLWKYNNGHQRFRNDISQWHDVIYVGDGFGGDKGLKYSVPVLVDEYKPDILMTYSYKYTQQYRFIDKVTTVPKVHFVDDLVPSVSGYKGSEAEYSRMLLDHKYDLCFCRTTRVVDFVLKNKLAPKAEFLPFSVDTSFYQPDQSLLKDIDVITPMSVVDGVYPLRAKAIDAVRKMGVKCQLDRVFKKEYRTSLQRSKVMVNSVNVWRAVNFKILEGMACGSVVVTDRPTDLELLGIKDEEHLVIFNGISDMLSKIREVLDDRLMRNRISKNAIQMAQRYHSNAHRVREMTMYMETYL